MVVIVGGMIGIGKTTTSKMLGKETGLKVYYESVEGNKVLPLFYTSSKEEKEKYRYPFLLQLSFLRSRFHAIKEALKNDNAIMDRSIYEDYYFARKNFELGNINEMEMNLYEGLLSEMMDELNLLTKKSPDVMVYLHGSFETVLNRIKERGRSFELDSELVSYYKFLYDGYDEWVHSSYKASPIISIDVDKKDIVYNESDKKEFLEELSRYNKIK
ncbi:MAG: deoxynucleoside kinase [Candidatus Enteromonas sp.]|nr:deoxynucleoside kinase [Mollicutes bacterium]MDY3904796.1 deoxynucleoside kinase [Candidatus Enteromonas sp.]